ncbi:MAG: hypothetical protein ABI383_05730 [Acidobacteriaceae bacterium]
MELRKWYNPEGSCGFQCVMQMVLRLARLFGIWLAPLFVCWIIFVGTFSQWELVVGAGAALLGGVGICVVESQDSAHFCPTLRAWLSLWRVPWYVLSDTREILWDVVRDLLGGRKADSVFRLATFAAGEERDPQDTGRRVLAVAYTTMTPSIVVLGVNVRDRYMLFHQIERTGIPKMTQALGAKS